MKYADIPACERAGLDPKKIESIAARLSRIGREANKLGITIFGGSGGGTLRFEVDDRPLIIADAEGNFDGGDGHERFDDDGLRWGES